jgi:RimJ/RimL family protein N-acetyltransferase
MITLANTPVLTTPRLALRAPQATDWPHFRDFALSERSVFVRQDDMDTAKAWRSFGHVIGMWVLRGYGSFVIERQGDRAPIGMCGPWHPIDWPEREIGWTIWTAAAEGQGLAFEAASAARDHAFRDLGWNTAVSYIDPANARSIALAERLGAVLDTTAPRPDPADIVYRHLGAA